MQEEKMNTSIVIEEAKLPEEYTLVYKKENKRKYILSKYRPKIDAEKVLNEDFGNKETLWILFGFMFGYILKPILDKVGQDAKILIIEPDAKLYKNQLKVSEYKELVKNNNVEVFVGNDLIKLKNTLNKEITVERLDNIKLIYIQEYNEVYLKYFTEVAKLINGIKGLKRVNQVTYNKYVEDIALNLIKGANHINNSYDIRQHKNKYKGVPALIISAGPSLSKNSHLIKEFKGMIFTGGRTLSTVLEQGVKPDFLASLDAGKIAYDLLTPYGENNFPLLTIAQSNYHVTINNKGPQYFVETHQGFIKELFNKDIESLDIGGSVALICLTAAQYMGCSPIIFIGQDLAYTDNKVHQGGNSINEAKLHTDPNAMKIKGYYGDEVFTDISWKLFKDEIERIIAKYPHTSYYNCTEGGAYIEGAEHKSFKEVIDLYKNIKKVQIEHLSPNQAMIIDTRAVLVEELKNLEIWEVEAEKGLCLAKELKETYLLNGDKSIINRNIEMIKIIDKQIAQAHTVLGSYVVGNLYNIINMQVRYKEAFNETEREKGFRTSELKMCLYNAIKQAARKNIEWIKEELGR